MNLATSMSIFRSRPTPKRKELFGSKLGMKVKAKAKRRAMNKISRKSRKASRP